MFQIRQPALFQIDLLLLLLSFRRQNRQQQLRLHQIGGKLLIQRLKLLHIHIFLLPAGFLHQIQAGQLQGRLIHAASHRLFLKFFREKRGQFQTLRLLSRRLIENRVDSDERQRPQILADLIEIQFFLLPVRTVRLRGNRHFHGAKFPRLYPDPLFFQFIRRLLGFFLLRIETDLIVIILLLALHIRHIGQGGVERPGLFQIPHFGQQRFF